MLSGAVLALLFGVLCIKYKANQTVCGVGLNLFSQGFTAVATFIIWSQEGISAVSYTHLDVYKRQYEAVKSVVEGNFKGEVIKLGLKENGVDFVTEGSNIIIPDEVKKNIEEAKEKIINGEIKVPSNMEELAEFEKNIE